MRALRISRITSQATLDEELFTTIREVAFYHKRSGDPMTLAYADCIDN